MPLRKFKKFYFFIYSDPCDEGKKIIYYSCDFLFYQQHVI
jgi:hypothetical protein